MTRFFLVGYYFIACLVRTVIYPLLHVVSTFHPWIRRRKKFEDKNRTDELSVSFLETGRRADIAFEVSSEGELEQIRPVLLQALEEKQNVELVYSSESVEKKCVSLASMHRDNLRILRLPIITFSLFPWPSSQNIFSWLTAKKLILCRYDFFPELMLYGGRSDVVFILLSATLKNKKIHGLRGIFCREIFNFFKLIVSATDRDADRFMELGIEQKKISVFDFRVIQIMDRMKNAGSVLKKWDFFEDYNGYLDGFSIDSRLLFGSAWPSEMGVFKNHEFIKCIMDGKISVTIAPHKLGKGFIDEIINSIKKFANDPLLEIYHLSGDMNSDEIRELFLNLKKKPGILVSSVPGILCELYSLHGNVFVGGGHGRSIHSVLEPYLAMANVFCGPKVHRSTEYDFILDNSPDFITIVFEIDKFYEIFNERYQKVIDSGKRKKLMTGFDVQFIDVYRKILGKGCDLYA
ncbi:MAG: hypothetical protein KAQ98_11420 [Bacteriovoracaceae bacterium]|nr:hypothetical protein [Bacteriovoracaceae bacterium]